jgi:site-specific DNA-methyltransferase (adenine-specific)
MPKLDANSISIVVTDPPYFLPINSYVGTRESGYEKRSLADTSILRCFFGQVFAETARILKEDGTAYVFCDAQSYPIIYEAMFPHFRHVRLLIWDKEISYNGYTWRHQHELIAWGELKESKRVPTGDGDIIRCRGVLQEDRNHPAEKPVELLEKLIIKHGRKGDLVLDPFTGSGSTAVASRHLGRNFIGFDLNPDYVKIANQRMQEARENQAIETFATENEEPVEVRYF